MKLTIVPLACIEKLATASAFVFLAFLLPCSTQAGQKEDVAARNEVIQRATSLFVEGKDGEALEALSDGLPRRNAAGQRSVELTLALNEISMHFFNQRRMSLAERVAKNAIDAATPLLRKATKQRADAGIFGSIGTLCEYVLHDPAMALEYYEAAIAAEPEREEVKRDLERVRSHEKKRKEIGL